MVRMMTYKDANRVLGSSLSPNNRCICKKTAIDNHAQKNPLAPFDNNRLVPAKTGSMKYGVVKQHYIVYRYEDGTVAKTEWLEEGAALNPPSHPSKDGYEPNGWLPALPAVATGDGDYTMQYVIKSYTITFVDDDGSVLQTLTVQHGSTPDPNTPTKSGYTFAGWSPALHAAYADETYTATWTEDTPPEPEYDGMLWLQGGYDSSLPWREEDSLVHPSFISIALSDYDTTVRSGRLVFTGYKYNYATKTVTQLPSDCYIDFVNVRYCGNVPSSGDGAVFTLSDALYNQGWRLGRGDGSEETAPSGWQGGWHGTKSDKSKTYYLGLTYPNEICMVGCPYDTPETMWFVNVSCETANINVTRAQVTPLDDSQGTIYTIMDNCYDDDRSYLHRRSYLDDSNLPQYSGIEGPYIPDSASRRDVHGVISIHAKS